jgi:hypothetical protein
MEINTVIYKLPAHFASYLINADASGLEDSEQNEIDAWVERRMAYHNTRVFRCVDCGEQYFTWHNDLDGLGNDVAEFTFQID